MKKFIRTLSRVLIPVLVFADIALCLILLAVIPDGKAGLFLAMLWAGVSSAALHWGIRGVLCLARKKARPGELKILTRTVEVLMSLLSVGTLVLAILLWDIPSVWLFLPVPLFGLAGVVRFDAERL